MSAPKFANNAQGTLGQAITAAQLTFVLTNTAMLPAINTGFDSSNNDYFDLTLTNGIDIEVVRAVAYNGGSFTFTRGTQGTVARSWAAGTKWELRLTADTANRMVMSNASQSSSISNGDENGNVQVLDQTPYGQYLPAGFSLRPATGSRFYYVVASGYAPANDAAIYAASPGEDILFGSATVRVMDTAGWYGRGNYSFGERALTVNGSVSFGAYSRAYDSSLALGTYCMANNNSVAIGGQSRAFGLGSVAMQGGRAYAPGGMAVAASVFHRGSESTGQFPSIQRDDWNIGGSADYYMSRQCSIASVYMDLGDVPPWQPSTTYRDGAVVRPTTPNGLQYHLWKSYYHESHNHSIVTPATEPIWWAPASMYDSIEADAPGANESYWIGVNAAEGPDVWFPDNLVFCPTEVVFVCHNYSGITSAPVVTIAADGKPPLVDAQAVTSITGPMQCHRFAITGTTCLTDEGLRFKVVTPGGGVGSQMHGRFFVGGTFMGI